MPTQLADPPAVVSKAVPRAAQKKLNELLRLRSETGLNWRQRAKLAAELLADREFLEAQCDGDEGRACDFLTGFAFDDLVSDGRDVSRLAAMYRDLPEEVWSANKYDPRKVEDAWLALKRPEPQPRGTRHVVSKKQLEAVEERAATAEYQAKMAEKLVEQERQRTADVERLAQKVKAESEQRLRAVETDAERRIRDLELENAQLKGRLAELERQLSLRAG